MKPKRHYDSAEMSRRGKMNKRSPWRKYTAVSPFASKKKPKKGS